MPFWYKLIPGSSRLPAPQKLIFLRPFKNGVISHPNHPLILFHHSNLIDFLPHKCFPIAQKSDFRLHCCGLRIKIGRNTNSTYLE